jgi:nucleoside-triphosphatase THEP1
LITGGPCGGKTSAMKKIREELGKFGFLIYTVPEVPTLTMNGGGMI